MDPSLVNPVDPSGSQTNSSSSRANLATSPSQPSVNTSDCPDLASRSSAFNQQGCDIVYHNGNVTSSLQQIPHQHHNVSNIPDFPIVSSYAIDFVRRLKNRFLAQPEVYKTFVGILQRYDHYRRHSLHGTTDTRIRPISPEQVFSEVNDLLEGHDDLKAQFAFFFPDRLETRHLPL